MSNQQNVFDKLNIPESQSKNQLKNKKLCEYLQYATDNVIKQQVTTQKGSFIILSISKLTEPLYPFRDCLIQLILNNQLINNIQIEEFIKFFKKTTYDDPNAFNPNNPNFNNDIQKELIEFCGVGVNFSNEEVQLVIEDALKDKIGELIKSSNINKEMGKFMLQIKDKDRKNIFIDGKMLKEEVDKVKEQLKDPNFIKKFDISEENKITNQIDNNSKTETDKIKVEKNKETNLIIGDLTTAEKLSTCIGREIKLAVNSEKIKNEHYAKFGKKVQTRFPPEPNGQLHIGHAKAMRFSFSMAKESGGYTYLRYDDTNPQAESQEQIDNILENVRWLGQEPFKVTYSSDQFGFIYDFAEQLVKANLAQICELDSETMREQRYNCIPSIQRDRPAEENLRLLRLMKTGYFDEGTVTLRLKIDMGSPNPTMRDPVAQRIMQTHHPRTADAWCIQPTQDFTHCIVDSLEGITHSLCTLEFEIRRDLYYWILDKLNIWKPSVWEFSRLNISYSVLSKRKIIKLVKDEIVDGWDDPRLFTLKGLRRRGYSPDVINAFVDLIGVARRGNDKMLDLKLLEHVAKEVLDKKCTRTMAVFEPLTLLILDQPETLKSQGDCLTVPNNPKDESMGTRKISTFGKLYVSKKDWRDVDSKNFFGLSQGKEVGLKYFGVVKVISKEGSQVTCRYVSDGKQNKPKGWITWIGEKDATHAKINVYKNLLTEPDLNKVENDWVSYIDHKSLASYDNALIDKRLAKVDKEHQVQFEREGYFVADLVNHSEKTPEFNLIVRLTDKADQ